MIRVGTRRSALALAQARLVAAELEDAQLVEIDTAGDRRRDLRFEQIGDGRGVFTREIERALLAGEIDVAVHSAKDLTGDMPDGLVIGAIPPREDARDACCGPFDSLAELPSGARVGTSSARRGGLLAQLRPDLQVVPLRGNVDTRLRKLDDGEADAIVLAAAGLLRLGLGARIAFLFDPAEFVPEAGQGALAVQVRAGEEHLVATLDDPPSRELVEAERARVAELGGGCTVPVAAHAWHEEGELRMRTWTAA
jgi:hydroxymethylbilane synthase